jgi:TonB family protein
MVHRLGVTEIRVAELGLCEVGSLSYIAHMSLLGCLLIYCGCFIVPPVTVPQVLDILLVDANSRDKIPEQSHEGLPTPNAPRYEEDFAKVFDGGENVAALKALRTVDNDRVDPAKIRASATATVKSPLPFPRPALMPMPLPVPVPIKDIRYLPQPAPPQRINGSLPAPLPEIVKLPPGPELTSAVHVLQTRMPVPAKASSDRTANRLDELAEEPCENSQKRLLAALTGNDMNESAPVPVLPPMGFMGSKEVNDGPRPTALSSLPQSGSLFAVKPAVPFIPAPEREPDMREPADPQVCSFIGDMERRILRHWVRADRPPYDDWRIIVQFKVLRNGDIANLKLLRSTREARDNDAALAAVRGAAPFPQLLEEWGDAVDIAFTFSQKTSLEQNAKNDTSRFNRF